MYLKWVQNHPRFLSYFPLLLTESSLASIKEDEKVMDAIEHILNNVNFFDKVKEVKDSIDQHGKFLDSIAEQLLPSKLE